VLAIRQQPLVKFKVKELVKKAAGHDAPDADGTPARRADLG
jgi:hypothetical protein